VCLCAYSHFVAYPHVPHRILADDDDSDDSDDPSVQSSDNVSHRGRSPRGSIDHHRLLPSAKDRLMCTSKSHNSRSFLSMASGACKRASSPNCIYKKMPIGNSGGWAIASAMSRVLFDGNICILYRTTTEICKCRRCTVRVLLLRFVCTHFDLNGFNLVLLLLLRFPYLDRQVSERRTQIMLLL
jgi:hypothetical protein